MVRTVLIVMVGLSLGGEAVHAQPTPLENAGRLVSYQYEELEDPRSQFAVMAKDAEFTVLGPQGDVVAIPGPKLAAALFGAHTLSSHMLQGLHPGVSKDGKTMWMQFETDDHLTVADGAAAGASYRASEIAVKTSAGWRVVGGLWSTSVTNARANEAARAGTLPALAAAARADIGDASVIAAFKALFTKGLDKTASARKELFAQGSAPDEDTRTGRALATAWKNAWVGHAQVDGGVRATVAESGTTAWVTANVKLTKTKGTASYAIPFRLLAVFDKIGGAWSLVHVHFAVPESTAR